MFNTGDRTQVYGFHPEKKSLMKETAALHTKIRRVCFNVKSQSIVIFSIAELYNRSLFSKEKLQIRISTQIFCNT